MPNDSNRRWGSPRRIPAMPIRLLGVSVLAAVVCAFAQPAPATSRPLTIAGARIVDGTGGPPRRATLRVDRGRIVGLGDVKAAEGDEIIDAAGLVLAPGFIDIHNHSTSGLVENPAAETQVAQGITTLVVGADGSSPWPIAPFLAERRATPAAVNVMVMVGHATVRRQVMGADYKRPAKDDEIARMAALVEQGMTEGAIGVWKKSADVVKMIEAARKRGVDVTADCYPYDAWHSTITVLVPNKKYDDPASVQKALDDVGGAGNVMIDRDTAHPEYEFKTLEAIAKAQGITPVALFIQIVKDGGASVVGKTMVEEDIRRFYAQPWVMVASDGGIGLRHPRSAGTFPRVLGKFVREQKWMFLQEAIRKMTSAPAARLTLADRGTLAVGKAADLVLFDPAAIADRATFQDPFVLPVGVKGVWVNGARVWDSGTPTGARPGQMLSR